MRLFRLIFFLVMLAVVPLYYWYRQEYIPKAPSGLYTLKANNENEKILFKLKEEGQLLGEYAQENNYNTEYCFLIDMTIPEGKNRFFVYNLKKNSIELSGLVTHGSCLLNGKDPEFSNVPGSNCSSDGKYRIGKSYYGKFGLAYKLYGLDKTNSKAFERYVVLHAHECVPDKEVYPLAICRSWGCPTVSPAFLKKLEVYIENAEEPILLNILK